MTEQQYRVIADATMKDLRTGDLAVVRVSEGFEDGAWSAEPGLVRIERPVPTTDEPEDDGWDSDSGWPEPHDLPPEYPSVPTREQIAEAKRTEMNKWLGGATQQQRAIASSWFNAGVDAVLALIQKGTDR